MTFLGLKTESPAFPSKEVVNTGNYVKNILPEQKRSPFAAKVTELRENANFIQNAVPDVSESSIQKIENQDHVPKDATILKIASAYSKDVASKTALFNELKRLADGERKRKAKEGKPTKERPNYHLAGVFRASTGESRVDAFRNLTLKANKRVVIMGIGMTNISRYGLSSLEKLAGKVKLDLFMLDPVMLESQTQFAEMLEDYLSLPEFTADARKAYNTLETFAQKWNSKRGRKNKVRFRVYRTIPILSMVMIDPDEKNGEMELEFYLYQCGEFRPRFSVKADGTKDNLFHLLHDRFSSLWKDSRKVVS